MVIIISLLMDILAIIAICLQSSHLLSFKVDDGFVENSILS